MSEICAGGIKDISLSNCYGKYGAVVKMWLDQDADGIPIVDALDESAWDAKINATIGSQLFIPHFSRLADDVKATVDEMVINRGGTGVKDKARNGDLVFMVHQKNPTVCQANRLKTFDGQEMNAYPVTKNEAILGDRDGDNFVGIPCKVFVDNIHTPENDDTSWSVTYEVHVSANDYMSYVVLPNQKELLPWRPTRKDGVKAMELTVTSSGVVAEEIKFTANTVCDAQPVSDLVTPGDFEVGVVSTGALIAAATAIAGPDTDGIYTLTQTGLTEVEHFIRYKNPVDATQKFLTTEESEVFTPSA